MPTLLVPLLLLVAGALLAWLSASLAALAAGSGAVLVMLHFLRDAPPDATTEQHGRPSLRLRGGVALMLGPLVTVFISLVAMLFGLS